MSNVRDMVDDFQTKWGSDVVYMYSHQW